MNQAEEHRAETTELPHRAPRVWGAVLVVIGLIGAFYLLPQHWNHAVSAWPHLLLLACPLVHLFHRPGGPGRLSGHRSRAGQV